MSKELASPAKLLLQRVIKAKRDKVFEAWTDPEKMSQWFYCGTGTALVKNDLRVGGRYENNMLLNSKVGESSACGRTSECNSHLHFGEYLEITPPERLVFTWNSEVVLNSRVTVELRDLGDSTELRLTHELLETEDLRNIHNIGWEGCLNNLTHYLN